MSEYEGRRKVRDEGGNIIDVPESGGSGATPTLAEVLAAGNTTGETAIIMPEGVIDGGSLGGNLYLEADLAENGIAGSLELGSVANGGAASLAGGFAAGIGGPGRVTASKGSSGQAGGSKIGGGNAEAASGAAGGDITLTPGHGDGAGRNGLVFLNLPTSDPGIAGAVYSDGVPSAGVPKALMVSGG